ncbi:GNAT family N-acetyltransferase [Pedobacter aquatilis]|uniref:GNAT family N-acetyltransferase n=1 Tax=Pedobacter aquatilis TaxID=351343 RepID=UPI00292D24BE|nr:GNAT family N-acetyltransferase [Pedobacter aquatilis]
MPVSIASPTDIPVLNILINSAYRGASSKTGWTTEADILGGIRIDEEGLEKYFAQSDTTLLKYTAESGELVGTVCLEVKPGELYLGMFAVSPALQAGGIGKALLAAAEVFALQHHCPKITISVISIREELIAWYKRNGYVPTGQAIAFEEIEGRFGDPKLEGITLITMEKILVK